MPSVPMQIRENPRHSLVFWSFKETQLEERPRNAVPSKFQLNPNPRLRYNVFPPKLYQGLGLASLPSRYSHPTDIASNSSRYNPIHSAWQLEGAKQTSYCIDSNGQNSFFVFFFTARSQSCLSSLLSSVKSPVSPLLTLPTPKAN